MIAHIPGFGSVMNVHATPLKESKESFEFMHSSGSTLILGDFNTTWHAVVQNFAPMALKYTAVSTPSYLPSKESKAAHFPPAFDIVAARRPEIGVRLAPHQVWKFQRYKGDFRARIAKMDLCSDHIPVEAVATKSGREYRCVTWNVADPFECARRHPEHAECITSGFDASEDMARLRVIRRVVRDVLMPRNDIIALQEVSEDLVDHLHHPDFVVTHRPYDDESNMFYVVCIRTSLSPSLPSACG